MKAPLIVFEPAHDWLRKQAALVTRHEDVFHGAAPGILAVFDHPAWRAPQRMLMLRAFLALVLLVLKCGSSHADDERPRLGFPSPPRFEARGNERTVDLAWEGSSFQVVTAVHGGQHTWDRQLVPHPTHIEVRDTIHNPTDATIGLRVRYAVHTGASLFVGGRPAPDGADTYNPWNPTVFVPTGSGGLGLLAEDDVLRNQIYVDNDLKSGTAGLRTDMLCLGPGDTVTLVWSAYPIATPSYWDFINTVRVDWAVNRTVPGSYIWFAPDDILAMDPDGLRAALDRQRVGIASLHGGWVDRRRHERPPLVALGTFVLNTEFASYRGRIREAVAKLKAARPQLRVLLYFDAQRDSSPDAAARFPDSVLVGRTNRADSTDWGGEFSRAWSMVPTTDNAFGTAMAKVPGEMRALGADGLYWDEIDAVDFSKPRVTEGVWDKRSCRLGPDGGVEKPVGLANLLSAAVKLEYARVGGPVLGNGPPTTRRFQDRPDTRMIEAQHNNTWGAFAHLSTPLGYISARTDWGIVLDKIDEGLLVAGIPLAYPHDIVARLFPFTPEYIQPGTLRGRERIVTTRSGLHGWEAATGPLRLYRYDASGKEHEAGWDVQEKDGGVHVRVELGPREAAVIERKDPP